MASELYSRLPLATFPVPEDHRLACPFCEAYVMEYAEIATTVPIAGYQCQGFARIGVKPVCGKFITQLEAESHIALRMVNSEPPPDRTDYIQVFL